MANIKDVCLALKLMRVASEKCTRINKKYFYDDYSKGNIQLLKTLNIITIITAITIITTITLNTHYHIISR